MKLAKVVGHVRATVKDAQLTGQKLLLVDMIDGAGKTLETGNVIMDTCGAGHNDVVLVATGSAARLSQQTSGIATDATAVAIIDEINQSGKATYKSD